MCVCVTVLLSLFVCLCVYQIAILCCVCGRECNNCLRLIPECDELSVPVKYLAHSHTLCVCCALPYYCTVCLRAVQLHCVLVRAVSSHCITVCLPCYTIELCPHTVCLLCFSMPSPYPSDLHQSTAWDANSNSSMC